MNILDETFVPPSEIFTANTPVAAIQNDEQVTEDADSECYIPDFDIGAKKLPSLYPAFHDIHKRDLLDDSLKKELHGPWQKVLMNTRNVIWKHI